MSGGSGSGSGGTSGNRAPTISGSPRKQVAAGAEYRFVPTASDADGDSLTFSVKNLPSWASFNPGTGEISGKPGDADVGNYLNVTISVSDGSASASLSSFAIAVVAIGTGTATLNWVAPTQNTDGSGITDLASYRVYWGPSAGYYTNSASIGIGSTTYTVDGLTEGQWHFAATAINASGIESTFSNVVSKVIQQ